MEKTRYYYKKKQKQYPKKWRDLADAPEGVYVEGSMPEEGVPTVAIVGSRMCSPYGQAQARLFAEELSRFGVQIISGLARGIDGHAHEGTLKGGGKTFAILGCGLDHCYPPEHKKLWRDIVEHEGGILSEFPNCTPPVPYNFPKRNRLISALSDIVLIVEAKERSGSLITADCALEQGKTVYAIPGRNGDALSAGCNRLIAQGAGIATSPECLLAELHIDKDRQMAKKEKINLGLASQLKLVYSCLDLQPKNLDTISMEVDMPLWQVSESLLTLELDGLVRQVGKNQYVKM